MPPSLEVLEHRLRGRATDDEHTIRKRLDKAEYEISFAPQFDMCIINDDIDRATSETAAAIRSFLARP